MALIASSLVRISPISNHGKSFCTRFAYESSGLSLRASANPNPKAHFIARRRESITVQQLERPLVEYMRLPASQYSVLDAERIERVNDNTFRCYVYKFKFFSFEICPVLLVRVEEKPDGCCIKLLSCKLEGSPMIAAQNDKFDGHIGLCPAFFPVQTGDFNCKSFATNNNLGCYTACAELDKELLWMKVRPNEFGLHSALSK